MRKYIAGLVAVSALTVLGGCSSLGDEVKETVSQTATNAGEQKYRELAPQRTNMTADEAVTAAKRTCEGLNNGQPMADIAADLISTYGASDAGFVFGGGTVVFCPQHSQSVRRWLDNLTSTTT